MTALHQRYNCFLNNEMNLLKDEFQHRGMIPISSYLPIFVMNVPEEKDRQFCCLSISKS